MIIKFNLFENKEDENSVINIDENEFNFSEFNDDRYDVEIGDKVFAFLFF